MSKGLENLNDLIIENLICSEKSQERVRIIEKELKVLEIIKEMLDDDLTEKLNANSRKIFKDIFDNLPKEKQDLLKEVML